MHWTKSHTSPGPHPESSRQPVTHWLGSVQPVLSSQTDPVGQSESERQLPLPLGASQMPGQGQVKH